jgi:iron complex outermembrane recepter protein
VSLPLSKSIEAQLALRQDRYSDYGSSTTPKVGAKWKVSDGILLRANWGKGFRAPTLPEISPSVATFFTTVTDPEDDVARQISGVFAGNPNLKAETSISRTFGLIVEPAKDMSVGLGMYVIDWRNVVASPSLQGLINASCRRGPGCPSTPNILRDPTTNTVVTIVSNYQNLQQRYTRGADVDFAIARQIPWGRLTVRADATYVDVFRENGTDVAGSNGGTNTIPRWRGTLSTDLDSGPWTFTGAVNYTHHVRQDLLAASWFANQDPRFQTGTFPTTVDSYNTLDLFVRYQVSKKLTVSGSVLNVFDKTPPYDPGFSSTSLYDFSLHDIRGRQFRFTMKYVM